MNNPQFVESDLPEVPVTVDVVRRATVPPDCYAVTDGETWAVYPKKYCRGAWIIKCRICGEPATHIDPQYPYFDDMNLCDECNQDKELEDE